MRAVCFSAALVVALAGCDGCSKEAARSERSTGAAAAPPAEAGAPPAPSDKEAGRDAGKDSGSTASALANGPLNVLLLTVDSLRADMPWAGYDRPIAPRLSALHARSVSFKNAYSTSSFTSKSVPGMLTGRVPSELVRTGSFFTKYLSPEQFVCTHLGAGGVPCVGAHAHMYFSPGQSGFETGFKSWKIVSGITFDYQTDPYVTSDKLTPLAIETLKDVASDESRPFVAWFHYMDPHDEYKTHEESPHFGKRARDLYDEEVFFTDLWIGKLLDFVEAQPWAKKTAIIVTADHGEAFGEHGITRHAHEVWEELVHVPFFVHIPGVAPRVIDASRGHADLAPTIVELVGAKNVPPLPGTSLVKELTGAEPEERDVIVDLPEDDYNERRRALIHGRKKLIAFGEDVRFALYDLEADPHEAKDLIVSDRELATEMRRRYKEASKNIKDQPPRGGIPKKQK
ncbi:MAG: Choline-sulfatase [Labilithrix sp.]|nr:Choline-sulfatase [Labilithrix sp.]